jgi:cytochrome b561
MLKNTEHRYGAVAQLFHWAVVGLIVTQFVLALRAESLPRGMKLINTLALHKSIGMTVLALAVLRLIWRWMNPVPANPMNVPKWQETAAKISHAALYILIFAIPLFGWIASSARNFSVSWFGLFTWPNLVEPNQSTFEFFQAAHAVLAWTLFAVALLHIAAALKHHFIDRDNVLRRMLPLKLKMDQRL